MDDLFFREIDDDNGTNTPAPQQQAPAGAAGGQMGGTQHNIQPIVGPRFPMPSSGSQVHSIESLIPAEMQRFRHAGSPLNAPGIVQPQPQQQVVQASATLPQQQLVVQQTPAGPSVDTKATTTQQIGPVGPQPQPIGTTPRPTQHMVAMGPPPAKAAAMDPSAATPIATQQMGPPPPPSASVNPMATQVIATQQMGPPPPPSAAVDPMAAQAIATQQFGPLPPAVPAVNPMAPTSTPAQQLGAIGPQAVPPTDPRVLMPPPSTPPQHQGSSSATATTPQSQMQHMAGTTPPGQPTNTPPDVAQASPAGATASPQQYQMRYPLSQSEG